MTESQFNTPFGLIQLERLPRRPKELLRAWDAADEYLLNKLSDESIPLGKVLICNDSFGALSVALHKAHPLSWTDSLMTQKATRENLKLNGFDEDDVSYLSSMQSPVSTLDLVLIKVPKTLALFEDQLIKLKPMLTDKTIVMAAGMAKSLTTAVWKILERIIGPTQTSSAHKKAKIISVTVDMTLALPVNPYPVKWQLEGTTFILSNHANVFSREKLDIGTRFLLEHLPQTEGQGDIIDLGCGNGVLGLMIAHQNKRAELHFVDESFMAIESTRENFSQLGYKADFATYHVSDNLSDFDDASIDLIVCNPPFHQQQAVGDFIATTMFKDSARVLKPGAELWVIGNRHLAYHVKLKTYFKNVEMVASNSKFVILKAF